MAEQLTDLLSHAQLHGQAAWWGLVVLNCRMPHEPLNGGVNCAWVPATFISLIVATLLGLRETINSEHCNLHQHVHTATHHSEFATLGF